MGHLSVVLRRRSVRIAGVVLLCVVLLAGVMLLAGRTADSLTISVHKVETSLCDAGLDCRPLMSNPRTGDQVFIKTYRDSTVVRQVQDEINGIPRGETELQLSFENGLCDNLPGSAIYLYDFRFEWHGIATQEAVVNSWCPDWHITTLGMPGIFSHLDGANTLARIAATADMPLTP